MGFLFFTTQQYQWQARKGVRGRAHLYTCPRVRMWGGKEDESIWTENTARVLQHAGPSFLSFFLSFFAFIFPSPPQITRSLLSNDAEPFSDSELKQKNSNQRTKLERKQEDEFSEAVL